jgi:predicted heme/steroid binding protein
LLKQSSIRMKKVLAILLLVLFVVSMTAAIVSAAAEMHNVTKTPKIKEFTPEELAKYNGKNMNAAYVADQGIVYDVSNSYLWKNGEHKGHHAGRDLTEELSKAAHGPGALMGFPVVGTLKNDSNSSFLTRVITRITHIV